MYFWEVEIKGADPQTIKILDDGYSIDKNSVYYLENKMENADLKTFEVLNFRYSKDKNNVYFRDEVINEANPGTFRSVDHGELGDGLHYDAEDKNNFYENGGIIKKK